MGLKKRIKNTSFFWNKRATLLENLDESVSETNSLLPDGQQLSAQDIDAAVKASFFDGKNDATENEKMIDVEFDENFYL